MTALVEYFRAGVVVTTNDAPAIAAAIETALAREGALPRRDRHRAPGDDRRVAGPVRGAQNGGRTMSTWARLSTYARKLTSFLGESEGRLTTRVIRSGMWISMSHGLNSVLEVVRQAILGRLLGPEAFGLLGICLVFTRGLELFTELGIINYGGVGGRRHIPIAPIQRPWCVTAAGLRCIGTANAGRPCSEAVNTPSIQKARILSSRRARLRMVSDGSGGCVCAGALPNSPVTSCRVSADGVVLNSSRSACSQR